MLVSVIPGKMCVSVVVHAGIVDGEEHCANNRQHFTSFADIEVLTP